jgi:glycosyltransferase involved in cell wall biosynthesis
MRIGVVFHKDPCCSPTGIDLVRLRAVTQELHSLGLDVEIVAPVGREFVLDSGISVRPLSILKVSGYFDLVKTCYHQSIRLVKDFQGPIVSRLVRIVDAQLPERDERNRSELLYCQDMIKERASGLVLNNVFNHRRWTRFYGSKQEIAIVPTGCPTTLPDQGDNPYTENYYPLLFLGSVAAPRILAVLNELASRLSKTCRIHLIGLNKISLYGNSCDSELTELIIDHGEMPEQELWNYIMFARVGLALAPGPHVFENDLSKIYNYLRAGLPVVSEECIVNNDLIGTTGLGRIFEFGNISDLENRIIEVLNTDFEQQRIETKGYMAKEHSWKQRAQVLANLFNRILLDNRDCS